MRRRNNWTSVTTVYDYSEHRKHRHQRSESDYRQEQADDRHPNYSPQEDEDPTQILIRLFQDVLNRRPSREEVRFYRNLMLEFGWTERQIRRELRDRHR